MLASGDIDVMVSMLDAIEHSAQVVDQIAHDIGAPLPCNGLDTLVAAIGDARVVFVIDNFEHVLDAATDLADLCRHCPNLTLLVTQPGPLASPR